MNTDRFLLWLGALVGLTGGLAFSVAGLAGHVAGPMFGALAGVGFAAITPNRARTAGGGLLWGLACALLWWFASLFPASLGRMPTMDAARAHFPSLVGALLLLGAPLGLTLGAYRARVETRDADSPENFSLWRALAAGGVAGGSGRRGVRVVDGALGINSCPWRRWWARSRPSSGWSCISCSRWLSAERSGYFFNGTCAVMVRAWVGGWRTGCSGGSSGR